MDDIPEEVLVHILSYLPAVYLRQARLVNRRFYYASFHPRAMRNVVYTLDERTPLFRLDGAPVRCVNVRVQCPLFVPRDAFWLHSSRTLTSVHYRKCYAKCLSCFRCCVNIRDVAFDECRVPNYVENGCATIARLRFDRCTLSDSFLCDLFASVTGLESFVADRCGGAFNALTWNRFYRRDDDDDAPCDSPDVFSFKCLFRLLRGQHRTLKQLTLCNQMVDNGAIQEILHDGLLRLERLDASATYLDRVCARCLPRKYKLSPTVHVDADKCQTGLVSLNLAKCASLDDNWVEHVRCMPRLKELDVSFTKITIRGLAETLKDSIVPDLSALNLSRLACEEDDVASMETLTDLFPNLKRLDVSRTCCTDSAVRVLIRRATALERLNLDYCPITSDLLNGTDRLDTLKNLKSISLRCGERRFERGAFVDRFRFDDLREVVVQRSVSSVDLKAILDDNRRLEKITFQCAVDRDALRENAPLLRKLREIKCDRKEEERQIQFYI